MVEIDSRLIELDRIELQDSSDLKNLWWGLLESWEPKDPHDFFVSVHIYIGYGIPGTCYYSFRYCTPLALARQLGEDGLWSGRHMLVTNCFDRQRLEEYVQALIDSIRDFPWDKQHQMLCMLGQSEYEPVEGPY